MKTVKQLLAFLLLCAFSTQLSAQNQFWVDVSTEFPCLGDTVTATIKTSPNSGPILFGDMTVYFQGTGGNQPVNSVQDTVIDFVVDSSGVYFIMGSATTTFGRDSFFFQFYVDTICPGNTISGVVYDDANGNGMQDPGEMGLGHQLVSIPNPTGWIYATYTDASGYYELKTGPGTFTVEVQTSQWYAITQPATGNYSITFSANSATSVSNDFGVQVMSNVTDLSIHSTGWLFRPGFKSWVYLNYYNLGTTTQSGTITYELDDSLHYDTAFPAPASVSGNLITWNYSSFAPGQMRHIVLEVTADTQLTMGTIIKNIATINPVVGDTFPDNNVDTLCEPVRASYDPNDKTAFPLGEGVAGNIAPRSSMRYMVRFQNTGTFFAENVRIEDTISGLLDPESISILDASHNFSFSVDGNALVIYFNQIFLPDSNSDEQGSHGWVTFDIDIKNWNSLALGTEINNTASIYFDFNDPIVTNTTRNTFKLASSIDNISDELIQSKVYPNPSNGQFKLQYDQAEPAPFQLMIYDLLGAQLAEESFETGGTKSLDLPLPSSLYIYAIEQDGEIKSMGKLKIE